jgi:hypothetical protein
VPETSSLELFRTLLRIYEDEGHGLARLANRLDAYPAAVTFLHDVLGE